MRRQGSLNDSFDSVLIVFLLRLRQEDGDWIPWRSRWRRAFAAHRSHCSGSSPGPRSCPRPGWQQRSFPAAPHRNEWSSACTVGHIKDNSQHQAHLGGTLLQGAHHRDEQVLTWRLEQASQQRDAPGLADGLLVLGALAAAPQRQGPAASHLHVLLLLPGQVGEIGRAVEQIYLRWWKTRGVLTRKSIPTNTKMCVNGQAFKKKVWGLLAGFVDSSIWQQQVVGRD